MADGLFERFTGPDGTAFTGGVTVKRSVPCGSQRLRGAQTTLLLTHDAAALLHVGDRVRRERDGAVFTVTGDDALRRAPASSVLQLAAVQVERTVYAGDA